MTELVVFLGLRYGLMVLDRAGFVPDRLHMPLVGMSWLYFLLVVALVVWRRHRGAAWSSLGLVLPVRPLPTLGLALAGVLAAMILDGLSRPLLETLFGSSQDLSTFRPLVGNVSLLTLMLMAAWIFAAFGEEVFYRGWLMPQVARILGGGGTARAAALILQAVLFGLAHLYQGSGGMIGTGLYGLVYGALAMRRRGALWAAILAHGLLDTFGLIAIFTGGLPV